MIKYVWVARVVIGCGSKGYVGLEWVVRVWK